MPLPPSKTCLSLIRSGAQQLMPQVPFHRVLAGIMLPTESALISSLEAHFLLLFLLFVLPVRDAAREDLTDLSAHIPVPHFVRYARLRATASPSRQRSLFTS